MNAQKGRVWAKVKVQEHCINHKILMFLVLEGKLCSLHCPPHGVICKIKSQKVFEKEVSPGYSINIRRYYFDLFLN